MWLSVVFYVFLLTRVNQIVQFCTLTGETTLLCFFGIVYEVVVFLVFLVLYFTMRFFGSSVVGI